MVTIGILFLLFCVILILLSAWKLEKLMIVCLFIGFTFIEINHYSNHGYWDALGIVGNLTVISFLFYFISIHKIMNKKTMELIKAGEFKEYLEENNMFFGYNRFIYYFPIFILFGMFVYCILYYY